MNSGSLLPTPGDLTVDYTGGWQTGTLVLPWTSPAAVLGFGGFTSAHGIDSVNLNWHSSSYHVLFAEALGTALSAGDAEEGHCWCPEGSQPSEGGRWGKPCGARPHYCAPSSPPQPQSPP